MTKPNWNNGALVDWQIISLVDSHQMITPFTAQKVTKVMGFNRTHLPSRGLSSAGYDFTVNSNYLRPVASGDKVMLGQTPMLEDKAYINSDGIEVIDLPPYGGILVSTVEQWRIPAFIRGTCEGKSTLAREFINITVTPLENGWVGGLTVEVTSHNPNTVQLPVKGGWGQILFELTEIPLNNYEDGGGRYQHQGKHAQQAIV